jgi:hypothetical protein
MKNIKSIIKELVLETLLEKAPPKFPYELEKELLKRYSDDPSKAYATMWTIHKKKNEGDEKINEMWMAWEQKSKNDVIQEGVQHHLKTKTPFTACIFRPGSTSFFNLMLEAKKLYIEGSYKTDDEYEEEVLKSDIGEYGLYEGKKVPLDYPHEDEDTTLTEFDVKEKTKGKGLNKPFRSDGGGAVYVKTGKDSIRKINFSQSGMKKRFNEPEALKSFMARHNCLDNKDKTTAGYWACRWPRYFSDSGKQWW